MSQECQGRAVSEAELHAFVDGELPAARCREVASYLDAHPDDADRVDAFLRLRAELATLARCPVEAAPARPLVRLEAALDGALRRQRRVRQVGVIAALAAIGAAWFVSGRRTEAAAQA